MNSDMKLIADYLDSRDTEACERLQLWLTEDPSRVRLFVDQILMHNDLQRIVLADDLTQYQNQGLNFPARLASQAHSQPVSASGEPARVVPKPLSGKHAGSRSLGSSLSPLMALAIAAGLFAVLALPALFPSQDKTAPSPSLARKHSQQRPTTRNPTSEQVVLPSKVPGFAATISDAENCQWEEDALSLSHGQQLPIGQEVALQAGLVQLTFETGVVVIVEGPCRLAVRENAIDLLLGKLSAIVPPKGFGFTVDTPNSQVVDLGTEFGITVDSTGDTEVHVFKGEVISRRTDDAGKPTSSFVRLAANRAIRFERGSKEAREFEANEASFTRRLRQVEHGDSFAVAPPVNGDLLLWLAADKGLIRDETGHAIAWLDTLTASSNAVADNAIQPVGEFRPAYVDNAISGLPALRFDGKDDCLTTTPVTNGDSQTIAFVASFSKDSKTFGQLINYNGPPQTELPQRRILQIRAARDHKTDRPLLDPFVYAGWRDELLFVGRVEEESRRSSEQFSSPTFERPFLAIYVYDVPNNRAELFVNGKSYGRSTAPISASVTSRKVIGRHGGLPRYFMGDIAEMLIYDEGLDDAQILQLTNKLVGKYSISVD